MATLVLRGGEEEFSWEITGLGSDFTSDHYIRVGIANESFEFGADSIRGIEGYKNATSSAPVSSDKKRSGAVWKSYGAGTFTFYGFAQAANGKYYPTDPISAKVTVDEAQVLPDKWSWTSSNGNASRTQTRNAKTAVDSNGYLTDFSYLVWNDMCDKVKEVLDAFGYSWSTQYGLSLPNTKMSSSNKKMTAARWNSLRYNVGIHYSTGISEVSVGDIIYGSYFTKLMSKVNDWIDRGY